MFVKSNHILDFFIPKVSDSLCVLLIHFYFGNMFLKSKNSTNFLKYGRDFINK